MKITKTTKSLLSKLSKFFAFGSVPESYLLSEYPFKPKVQKSILLVEDDPIALIVIGRLLELTGAEVIKVNSVQDAIFYLKSHSPDLIITDLHFPDQISGLSLLHSLKNSSTWKQIPAIVISGTMELHMAHQALTLGAMDFVSKPVIPDNFTKRVHLRLEDNE